MVDERPAELSCICATMRMASRTLTRRYDDALRPAGLRTTQLSILDRLDEEGAITMGRLARRLALERTTLTRDIAPLARRGLVRVAAGADRRERILELTEEGRDVLAAALPRWRDVQDETKRVLGSERVDRLLADLRETARS